MPLRVRCVAFEQVIGCHRNRDLLALVGGMVKLSFYIEQTEKVASELVTSH
jgi:hypothetical protein